MTNRVPPRAPLSTLPAAAVPLPRPASLVRMHSPLVAAPRPTPLPACYAPSLEVPPRPATITEARRCLQACALPCTLAIHAGTRPHATVRAPNPLRHCVDSGGGCDTCGRGSPSRLRRPALLLHAARRVPAPSTLHAALYTARAHPTAPYGAIPPPNKRCKWLGLGPPFPLFNPADVWQLSSVRGVGACRHDRRGRARPQCMYTAEALFGALTSWPGLA